MSGTYRRVIAFVHDGAQPSEVSDEMGSTFNSQHARKFVKRMSRRNQRRQQAAIERAAIAEYYADQEFDMFDYLDDDFSLADDFNEWYNEHQWEEEYDDYDDYDDYCFDDYDDYSYADNWYSSRRGTNYPMTTHQRTITREDEGKTLAEILSEMGVDNL